MLAKDHPILKIVNKEEEKFLRKKPANFDFTKYTEKDLRELIASMKCIMRNANGIGLSANQVGLDMQMFIVEMPQRNKGPKLYAIFNPKIESASKELLTSEEGCLSVPKMYGLVSRPKGVILSGFDKHKKPIKIKAAGLLAKAFQHEMDHLNGIVFIDKATNIYEQKPESSHEQG